MTPTVPLDSDRPEGKPMGRTSVDKSKDSVRAGAFLRGPKERKTDRSASAQP